MSIKHDAGKVLKEMTGYSATLSKFLYAIRKCDEMTQLEFATLLGISKPYLCDVERGRGIVSPKMAAIFAEKLGYSSLQFVRIALQDELKGSDLHMTLYF